MKKLDEILAGKKSVGLAGHVRPDGDCVGSTLGVYNYIRKYYPDVDVRLYLEPIPNIFKFLNFSSEIRSDYEESVVFDLFIAMDCGDEKRLGNAARYFQEQSIQPVLTTMSVTRVLQRKIIFSRMQFPLLS